MRAVRTNRDRHDRPIQHVWADLSPWIILGTAAILAAIVAVMAVRGASQERYHMSQILQEKGAALIRAFESGARTGIGMRWGRMQLQTLLEETAKEPGMLYLAVTDESGTILAHNDRSLIGTQFRSPGAIRAMEPSETEKWRLQDENGGHAFEVYRIFQPMGRGMHMGRQMWTEDSCPMIREEDHHGPPEPAGRQIIFVGLDTAHFDMARRADIRNMVVTSSVLLLLGFGGVVSLFLAQSYRTSRRLLRDTKAFASEVVTNLPVGIITTDSDGRIAMVNEAAERITGLARSAATGKTPDDILPDNWCGLRGDVEAGRAVLEREVECAFGGAKKVSVSLSATAIVNDAGEFVGNVFILRDLGEVRRLEAEVRRREKLAALGSLAAGVAHEIRNPLSSIKGFATYFGAKFSEGSEDREAAEVMVREVDRLNRVISELLEFARPSDIASKATDLNDILEHSLRLVGQDAALKGITVDFRRGADLPPAVLDRDRFTQALLNLYLNAFQAMGAGGTLTVTSRSGEGGAVVVEVADTGKGVAASDLGSIFNPYFTTKPSGTGLGLAIVHKIVEAHKGSIAVRSEPGRGTVFTITVPASGRDAEAA